MKAALIGLWFLFSVGCGAAWTEAPKALDPVSQNLFPVAGQTLEALGAAFYKLCPTDKPRPEACLQARDTINKAVDAYNKANDLVLEAY